MLVSPCYNEGCFSWIEKSGQQGSNCKELTILLLLFCRAASIHPLFVFSGLSLIRKDKPHVNEDPKLAKRNAAWDAINAGKMDLALSTWTSSYAVHQPDLIHLVIRILKENNVEYMRAPYGAGAQVRALSPADIYQYQIMVAKWQWQEIECKNS